MYSMTTKQSIPEQVLKRRNGGVRVVAGRHKTGRPHLKPVCFDSSEIALHPELTN